MFKNVAAKFIVFAFDATTNVPKTGDAANLTAYVSKDYGAVTVLGDTSATEMDATNAPGYYLFDAAQGETNADCLMISGKSSTANIKVIGAPAVIYTRPTTGWLAPTTAGRTLTVDASGRALSDVDTIKTNAVVNGGTFTFPTNATGASTTNITAGTITTASNLTTNNDKTGYALTAAYDPAKTASQAGDAMALTAGERTTLTAAIWAFVVTGTTTATQAMRGFIAAMLGKASGLETTTAVYRNIADTKDVITATVDADGNRTAVTLDLT